MEITLVYPHQLFAKHPAISPGRRIYLIEDSLFFGNDPHWPAAMHRQKLMLHRASMKAYEAELLADGHRVTYVDVADGFTLPKSARIIHLADPADDVLLRRLNRLAEQHGVKLTIHKSPNFLSPPGFWKPTSVPKRNPSWRSSTKPSASG
jgi:deoxyribodipyrimidine photolyase-related protein